MVQDLNLPIQIYHLQSLDIYQNFYGSQLIALHTK